MNNIKTIGYAAYSRGAALSPYVFERRALRDNDVAMEVPIVVAPFRFTYRP